MKGNAAYFVKEGGDSCSKTGNPCPMHTPPHPEGFQQTFFKGEVGQGHPRVWGALMHNSLIG